MTLIEIMVAILVLLIAALGTSGVRYHTELNVRKAEAQIAVARVRSLLCESWRGSNVNIATNPDGPDVESGYSALDNVKVIVDDQNFMTFIGLGMFGWLRRKRL